MYTDQMYSTNQLLNQITITICFVFAAERLIGRIIQRHYAEACSSEKYHLR